MSELVITGASDDLIEIDGALTEEFVWYPSSIDERTYLVVSDGTLIEVHYDFFGIWRFKRLVAGSSECFHVQGDETKDRHDVIKLTGEHFYWIMLGRQIARAK